MAQIDVSELLNDPDFVDPVQLVRRQPFVNEMGENSFEITETISTVGSVQPATGDVINRLPESLRAMQVMSFWIKGEIVSDGQCQYPDLIIYKGDSYEVQTVMDWTNYGITGYSEGTAIRRKISL